MVIEVTEPQEGWKRCSKCGRDGFRPPWQGYCHPCQRAYETERRAARKAEREAWAKAQEREYYHSQQRALAMTQGIDPDTIELEDPPWWTDVD